MTSRIATMPRMPPVSITHSFGDIATATRIESIANTMSVSSTFTTVAQKADIPSQARAGIGRPALARVAGPEEVLVRQPEQVQPADELHQRQLDHVRREDDGQAAEDKGADDPVAQRLLLLLRGSPSTSTASTIALSALSSPSRRTSRRMVTRSAGAKSMWRPNKYDANGRRSASPSRHRHR